MSKWMVRILVERMRKHPRPQVANRFHTIGYTLGWQTSAVSGTVREAFWHAQRFCRNLVMVSMDIRHCFDHMDIRRVVTALQSRHLPRWFVRGFARELRHLKAKARIAVADWTQDFDFSKGGKTGGVDTLALLKNSCSTTSQHSRNGGTRQKRGSLSAVTATTKR